MAPIQHSKSHHSRKKTIDSMPRPPASLRSCGSSAYIASYIDTGSEWPASSIHNMITNPRAYSDATQVAESYAQNPTVEEALSTLERAAKALRIRRYRQALRLYLDGGYALANVAEQQTDPKIRNLLMSKGFEILNWCGKLCEWIEGRVSDRLPRPGVHKVGIPTSRNLMWNGWPLEEEEACRLWYTPVHCTEPIQFTAAGYRLRCIEVKRRPKLMVCLTLYNEGPQELKASLATLGRNLIYLRDLQKHKREKFPIKASNREDFWQEFLVCIVLDGRESAHAKTLQYLNAVDLFDEDLLAINGAGLDAHCHLFEHTLQLVVDHTSLPPLQTILAIKEQKTRKLGSHEWFFHSFAEQIQPEYTFLMDSGTKLDECAIYRMLFAFEQNPQIGGACGQIVVDEPYAEFSNWVVSAQHFEYKIVNLLDRTLESCFGSLTVLPGAFSAYRYEAIRGAPLTAYFQSLHVDLDVLGPFVANMHLAEDRVLCFEIVARRNCNWTLHFVRDAIARTDVPRNLIELIKQRKRWMNGSFFATLFMLYRSHRVFSESCHSFPRKLAFAVFVIFESFKLLCNFLLPSNVYLALYFLVFDGFRENRWTFVNTFDFSPLILSGSVYVFHLAYAASLIMLIVLSMGNSPHRMKLCYYLISSVYGAIMMLSSMVAFGNFISGSSVDASSVALFLLTLGVYYIGPAFHGDLHHIFLTCSHYTIFIPTFVNILAIYGFSNLHNLSWGTKGLYKEDIALYHEDIMQETERRDYKSVLAVQKCLEEHKREAAARAEKQKEEFEAFRTNVLAMWVSWNVMFALVVLHQMPAWLYLKIFYVVIAVINTARLVGSLAYIVYMYTGAYRGMFITKQSGNKAMGSNQVENIYYEEMDNTFIGSHASSHTSMSTI